MELMEGAYNSPRWSWEILDCAMPLTFDTYDNCSFQCVYCFSFFQRAVGSGADDYLHHRVRSVSVEAVKKLFRSEATPKRMESFGWYIQRRMVLQWGGLSDGFDYYERKFRKSLELMRFFREIDYPISISTKGVWFVHDKEYEEVFANAKNVHVKTSIVTLDEAKASKIERGVATSEQRFQMLEWMNKIGVAATTVRFRPFVLGASADYPFTRHSRDQLFAYVKRAKEAGVYSLTSEFLAWESRASNTSKERLQILGAVTGIPDLFGFFRCNSPASSGLLRMNYEIKRPYFETMREACDLHGVKFFISDAHHKEKSYSAGCCGLPDTGPLSNINRGQYAEAILIAKRVGRVTWPDIAVDAEPLRNIEFFGAEGFNTASTHERVKRRYQTMFDYMRDVWNNPTSVMSPARYFGGALVPSGVDDQGDIIYTYNEPFVERGERVSSASELTIKLHQAQVEETQMDGGTWGHVAYPITINATNSTPHEIEVVRQWLHHTRLNALWYLEAKQAKPDNGLDYSVVPNEPETHDSYTKAEVDDLIRATHKYIGDEWIWIINPKELLYSVGNGMEFDLRAALSRTEGELSNMQLDELEGCVGGTVGGTLLFHCATLDNEQREARGLL